jgi:hypothetical protein
MGQNQKLADALRDERDRSKHSPKRSRSSVSRRRRSACSSGPTTTARSMS